MTEKQKAYRVSLIRQIHTSRKWRQHYADNRDDYETKLTEHFGVSSSTRLNIKQLIALAKWMNDELPELPVIMDRTAEATARQMSAIYGLWSKYADDPSDNALRKFIARITGKTYLHIDRMAKSDATMVIVALKKTLKER